MTTGIKTVAHISADVIKNRKISRSTKKLGYFIMSAGEDLGLFGI